MHCKYCNTAIPSTTRICPNCGKMASKDQMQYLKDFNKKEWNKGLYSNTNKYSNESKTENRKKIGIILIPIIILILAVIALFKVIEG